MFKLSNEAYDVLVKITKYVLPALATAYFTLSSVWGFPLAEQVVGTIAVIETFLGVVLGISTKAFNKEIDDRVTEFAEELEGPTGYELDQTTFTDLDKDTSQATRQLRTDADSDA